MIQILIKEIHSTGPIPLEKPDYIDQMRWKKIREIASGEDKLRSFTAGYLLSYMCRELGITNYKYVYTEEGKASIENGLCAFNISHSGDYAVLAYHQTTEPVGVDIQQIRMMREGMEKKILHDREKMLLSEDAKFRQYYLNRIWTVKESFVKMTGKGLSCDFRTFYVDFDKEVVVTEDGIAASFTMGEMEEGYFYCVCTINKEVVQIEQI